MGKDSVKSNFVFQLLYQIVTLVIPLIIAPYLTRKLGGTQLGIYTYTYSIVFCFMSLARLGIDKHGQRVLASVRDDNEKLRVTFWSLYTVHIFFSMISLFLYFGFVLFFTEKYRLIYIIQGMALFGVLFDVTWLFYGLENFKFIVLENLCVKVSELVLIFNFVKDKGDFINYTLIEALSLCTGFFVVLPFVICSIKPIKFSVQDLVKHLKPLFILFIAVVATTLYQMIDKTLLGMLSTKENVAYFEYANKIVNVPINLVYVMGTVLMPRACLYAYRGDKRNQLKYINYSLHFVGFISFAAIFGLISISKLFSTIYYGVGFAKCGNVMQLLSPIIILLGIDNIIRTQYMIPNNMDKQFTSCLLITTILNLLFSVILIPMFGVYGSVLGTLIAESICTILQIIICKSFISMGQILKVIFPYIFSGIAMLGMIYIIKQYFNQSIVHLLIQVVVGAFSYCLLSGIYILFFSNIKQIARAELSKFIYKFG